jgi:(2Fe-2S) ferredoxin
MNGTSEDGLFTLQEVECLGACANAPMIQVNNEYFYEDLTYDSMQELMQTWKDGNEPTVGPQNGRINALGIDGRTSLTDIPEGGINRDFGAAKQAWQDAKDAAAAAKK